jgi:hypothetical protein
LSAIDEPVLAADEERREAEVGLEHRAVGGLAARPGRS